MPKLLRLTVCGIDLKVGHAPLVIRKCQGEIFISRHDASDSEQRASSSIAHIHGCPGFALVVLRWVNTIERVIEETSGPPIQPQHGTHLHRARACVRMLVARKVEVNVIGYKKLLELINVALHHQSMQRIPQGISKTTRCLRPVG